MKLISLNEAGSFKIPSKLLVLLFVEDARILTNLSAIKMLLICFSLLRKSSWHIKASQLVVCLPKMEKFACKLNFKKGLSSIKVDTKLLGP